MYPVATLFRVVSTYVDPRTHQEVRAGWPERSTLREARADVEAALHFAATAQSGTAGGALPPEVGQPVYVADLGLPVPPTVTGVVFRRMRAVRESEYYWRLYDFRQVTYRLSRNAPMLAHEIDYAPIGSARIDGLVNGRWVRLRRRHL